MPKTAIERVDAATARRIVPGLVALLQDTVADGASVGFVPPLGDENARAYWDGAIDDLTEERRVLFVALQDGDVVGSVQLEPASRANGAHRAEVQKLMVHRRARRQGIGLGLMAALEEHARRIGRLLLVLDTREGDGSEALYQRCGYIRVGVIPRYARSATGTLDGTVYYYRHLDET